MKWASADNLNLPRYEQIKVTQERTHILEEKAKQRGLRAKFSGGFSLEGAQKGKYLLPEEEADNFMLAAIHSKLNLIDML